MKKVVIRKSAIDSFSFLNAETIEKARKGEQIGGEYIYREEIAERVTTDKNGNKRTTRYKYYYVDDMLKDSETSILDKIMKFFYKKYPENRAKIEKSYEKENINKDYGVDKKTYFQHVMEYLANRSFWDKKFAKKEINEKYKKPVVEPKEPVIQDEDDIPENEKQVIEKKEKEPKKEKKWIPNKSLMRKIWSLNTGKEIEKQEKVKELAKQKVQEELLQNSQPKELVSQLVTMEKNRETSKVINSKVQELFSKIFDNLPADKAEVIKRACKRNESLTSSYLLENCDVEVYPSGVYFKLEGTRCSASLYVDNNGEIGRKKNEEKLYTTSFKASNVVNFNDLRRKESEQEKHDNRSEAMMGNQNAKKDFVSQEETNEQNNIDIEQGRISGSDKDLRTTSFTDSNENVYGPADTDNGNSDVLNVDESGDGPTNAESIDRLLATIGNGTGRLTAKQARLIREACHKLLAEKTDEQMTEKDKALLAQFVGVGGAKEDNASNTGVLTEFYTPRIVVNKCWELLDKWLPNKKTCIEPSSGIGRFAEGRQEQFTMCELEEDSARIAKILHPEATVIQGEFEKNWVRGGKFHDKFQKFDCSVGNPPYMEFTGLYKGKYGEGKEFSRAEQYFLNRTLDSLKDNGVLVFVMPSSFLSGNSPAQRKAKEIIASKGKLLEAWRLPNGTFDTTSVGTDIIVVRKEKGDINDFISDNYFKNNPSHIAGDVVKKPGRFGLVDVVQPRNGESFETEIDKINIRDIEAEIKELPESETIIEEAPKDPNARSKALEGNQNAKGKHKVNFVESTGKNMTPAEFAHKYGFDMDQKELDIWKFTDYNGNIDTTKLTPDQIEYINNSDKYVKIGDKVVNIVNYASGNIREKLNELEVEYKGGEITQEDYDFKKSILAEAMPVQKEIGQFTMSPIADWTRKYVKQDGTSLIAGFYEWVFAGNVNFESKELPIDSPIAPEEIPSVISFADVIDYIDRKSLKSNGFRTKDSTLDKDKLKFIRTEKRRETAEYLFNKYLKEGLSPEDQEELTKRWNDNYNAYKNPDYTKIPIFIDGMNENKGTKEFTLTKQQLKGVSFLTNKGAGLLAYDVGVGKALANSEKVLTPSGWVENGTLKAGDLVIGDNGEAVKIEKVYPQGAQDIYEVKFSDGAKVRCTKEHLWTVQLPYMRNKAQTKNKDKYKTLELQEFMNNLYNSRGEKKYSIPMCKPVEFDKKNLLINPYLMGVLLGDGSLKINGINVTSEDDFILNKIKPMLQNCELVHAGKYDYRITCPFVDVNKGVYNPIVQAVKKYGLENHKSINKFIPQDYLFSSVEDRIELLRGLLDTDGYVNKNGTSIIYYTISERLVNDIRQLVMSLGGTVIVSGKQGKYKKDGKVINCQYCYVVVIKLDGINPFSLPRKANLVVPKTKYKPIRYIVEVNYIGKEEATCIWVNNDSHLYITNDYVVTHNTVTGICATINQIQTGKSKRPLICVPNAVYQNWITEIRQFFPNIKLNELHNFNKDSLARDWKPEEGSLSICTYEALEKITFKDETMNEIAQDVEYAMITGRGKEKSDRKKALESEKIKEVAGRMVKSDDDFVNFEDLGFDHITVDEIHNFKNIFYSPRNVDIKTEEGEENNKANNEFSSLGGSKSDRGEKLFAITQYIQRHNNNRNVFGLSATPFQNSPVEIYNILSLFARQRMKDLGIYSLEEFVKQFARLRSEYAVTATGYKEKMVMKGFNNLQALQNLIAEYIDKVDGGEAHVIRPRKRVHLPKLEMTDLQRQIMEAESAYIEQQASLPKDERDLGSTFLSLNAMRMATLSPALVKEDRFEVYKQLGFNIEKPDYKQLVESSPKLKFTCDSIVENYKKASKEGQVMYMPKGVTHFNEVVNYLVKKGIPKEAIGLMPGGGGLKGQLEREAITKDFNDVDGKIKIIIGSEAIKEGVSLNGNSTILYNTMLGWNPTEPQQVEGRIWRQGNKQGITHIVYPLLNDSIDPMLYQKYDEKKSRIEAVFSYKGDSVNIDEIDAEELKYALIRDPAKRADLLTRQHKEKAESDRALYAQMIDILARQSTVAFGDLERIPEYSQSKNALEQTKKMYDIQSVAYKNWSAKAKDGNEQAVRMVESIQKYLGPAKVKMDELKKAMKRVENNQLSVRKTLEKRGIKSVEDVEKKRKEYYTLMASARQEAENAENMRDEYYKKAVEDNLKNAGSIPTYEEMLKMEVDGIRNDLHPMDEEFRAVLVKENEEQFGKSLPRFIFYQGRFLIRK